MVRDKLDATTLILVVVGCGALAAGIFGYWLPDAWGWFTVAAMGVPAILGGVVHLYDRHCQADAEVEQLRTLNYARWLANTERERKLQAAEKQPATNRQAWVEAVERFMLHGFRYGFTIRKLARLTRADAEIPGKCVSEGDWNLLRGLLVEWGVLIGDSNNTKLSRGWTRERWERDRFSLPYPTTEPPTVSIFVGDDDNATPVNTAQQPETAA